jgi:hypothetical protein
LFPRRGAEHFHCPVRTFRFRSASRTAAIVQARIASATATPKEGSIPTSAVTESRSRAAIAVSTKYRLGPVRGSQGRRRKPSSCKTNLTTIQTIRIAAITRYMDCFQSHGMYGSYPIFLNTQIGKSGADALAILSVAILSLSRKHHGIEYRSEARRQGPAPQGPAPQSSCGSSVRRTL